jgi:hypothetical protein
MKNIVLFLSIAYLISACLPSKDINLSRAENRKLKRLTEQAEIKKAVESRRYIIRVDRLFTRGAIIEMVPSANFVIVNGGIASVSLGYSGGNFGGRKITGINMNGRTTSYKMETNDSKGLYKIQMSVIYGSDKFDMFLTIGTNGDCNISLNNSYIQTVTYTGKLIPLAAPAVVPADKNSRI